MPLLWHYTCPLFLFHSRSFSAKFRTAFPLKSMILIIICQIAYALSMAVIYTSPRSIYLRASSEVGNFSSQVFFTCALSGNLQITPLQTSYASRSTRTKWCMSLYSSYATQGTFNCDILTR